MSNNPRIARLTLHVDAGEGVDDDDLDRLTRQLRGEIDELGVESVDLVTGGAVPKGARAGELVTLGVLAVAVLPATLPHMINFLRDWSLREEKRSVKIKAQVGDRSVEVAYNPSTMSQSELKQLVDTLTGVLDD